MKNIEKYQNTNDALEAYNSLNIKNLPFDEWLGCEYEEPRQLTLLEAANEVVKTWYARLPEGSIARVGQSVVRLSVAIKREKHKPVRNFDKYKTAEDAEAGFEGFCKKRICGLCRFYKGKTVSLCRFAWLYSESDKEDVK